MLQFAPALWLPTVVGQPDVSTEVEWLWNRDTPGCSLRQAISAEGQTLVLSRTPGANQTTLSIEWSLPVAPSYNVRAEALPGARFVFVGGGPADADVWTLKDGRGRRYVSLVSDDADFMSKFSSASAVEITHDRIGTVRAPLRSTSAAAYALRSCEDTKMRDWGIDPVAWRGLKAHPIPVKPTNWLTDVDYPRKALRYGLRGWGIARVEIGADGRIKACTSINGGLYREFSDTVCSVLKRRARFLPARDSNDNAVAAPYVAMIRFNTP